MTEEEMEVVADQAKEIAEDAVREFRDISEGAGSDIQLLIGLAVEVIVRHNVYTTALMAHKRKEQDECE